MAELTADFVSSRSRATLTRAWIVLLGVGGITMCAALVHSGWGLGSPIPVLVLAASTLAVERESVRLTPQLEVSVSSLIYIFAAVVFGPLAGVFVGVAGLLVDLPRRDGEQPLLRWVTWTSLRTITVGSAGLAAAAVLAAGGHGFLAMFGAVSAALAVESLLDIVLAATTIAIRRGKAWLETARDLAPALTVSVPLHAPMIAMLVYAYTTVSPWSVVLFAAPAFAAQRLLL